MSAFAYYARCPRCRGVVMATVDAPDTKRATAREVAAAVARGLVVLRASVAKVRAMRWCGHWNGLPVDGGSLAEHSILGTRS